MTDQRGTTLVDEPPNIESKPNSPLEIDKILLEDIIGTVSQTDTVAESLDTSDNHVTAEKTNEVDNSEQTNLKKSRELKLLLALSKEANLDTNISHKRNSLEASKTKDKDFFKTGSTLLDPDIKRAAKVAHENRDFRYPVTAEAELESDHSDNSKRNLGDNANKVSKRKREGLIEVSVGGATEEFGKKNKKPLSAEMTTFKLNKDIFCWRCHREGVNIACETCPRSYHQKCLKQTINDTEHWPCPECVSILKAESTQTRSAALKGMTLEHLCSLLKFAVRRMIQCQGSEPFLHAVNDIEFPDYKKYIVQPMDLTKMKKNIKENLYGSTQAFEADAKWLLHNSIIYNSYQSKLTTTARGIIKICKQEMAEIENCPSCYLNANTKKDTWFVEVCPKPHLLVWAKLKGFPFWPAKAMCTNSSGMVDVRFFGAHDRAWVHYKECYLFSEKDPNTFKQKRFDIEKCVAELNIYIENLRKIYGEFRYAPFKTILEPENELKQLQIFLPKYKTVPVKKKTHKNDNNNGKNGSEEDKKDTSNSEDSDIKRESPTEKKDSDKDTKTSNETKDDIELDKKISDAKDTESDINQNGSDVNVNGISSRHVARVVLNKFNDDIMEGYGTDDDANPEIDLERRKRFIDRTTDKSKDKNEETVQDEEEEDDTQVPSNISVESPPVKEGDKKQENIILTARRVSDSSFNQKRLSGEDSQSPPKIPRRNSDLNVKSDSILMPSISEKINRVNISEDMEITLGNDDIGCVSISENVSSNSSDSEVSHSGSEQGKRKPVQVDIENAELTISPTNKLKISDKLIKRLSDGEKNEAAASKVEEAKKNFEKKSPTDILIEKFKNVVDREIVDFSHPSPSSEEESSKAKESDNQSKNTENDNKSNPAPASNGKNVLLQGNLRDVEKNKNPIQVETSTESRKQNKEEVTKKINLHAETEKENAPLTSKLCDRSDDVVDKKTVSEKAKLTDTPYKEKEASPKDKTSTKSETSEDILKKQKCLVQLAVTESSVSSSVDDDDKKDDDDRNQAVSKTEVTKPVSRPKTPTNPVVTNIIQEFEDSEEMDTLDDIEIDKNKIFNIIHSSLNASKMKEPIHSSVNPPNTKESNEKDKTVAEPSNEVDSSSLNRKRKVTSNENTPTQAKIVKLVPIESILNKSIENGKETTSSPLLQRSLQGKKMIPNPSSSCSTPASSISRKSSIQEITAEDIKSEPETDEEFSESENLEAKRKYLSALNISEKISDADKKQANAIRTRSKTEEKREKFKKLDNLSRVIDDVALNYNAAKEAQKVPVVAVGKSPANPQEGEIFVKSFAKLQSYKARARKSFPTPSYVRPTVQPKTNTQFSLLRKETFPSAIVSKDFTKSNVTLSSNKIVLNKAVTTVSQSLQTTESISGPVSHVIILPPTSSINYSSPIMHPVLTMVSSDVSATTTASTTQTATPALHKTVPITPNVVASQNYIPQNGQRNETAPGSSMGPHKTINQPTPNQPTPNQPTPNQPTTNQPAPTQPASAPPVREAVQPQAPESSSNPPPNETNQDEEFGILNSLLPENISRAVSDLLLRAPPRLKPRPPGPLSTVFDEGVPSSAGNVTSKINSVAHRLGDYFRGMLIETLEDLGKSSTPEAKITTLQMEIETLKHRHNVEMSEIRKNVCTILKDIQKSIVEDRERIIDETRAACEAETIKRVEVAKSKQWCANCTKEAQFYCCWNTSYCDYPCQQKHWPQHVGKCTQNIEKGSSIATPSNRPPGQQLILRPTAPPKPGMGRIVAKPTKVYMNRAGGTPKPFKALTTSGNHITVIETTPGNYELVGNGPITMSGKIGKYVASPAMFHPKFKSANVVSVSSPSTSGHVDQRLIQRVNTSTSESTCHGHMTSVASLSSTVLDDDTD